MKHIVIFLFLFLFLNSCTVVEKESKIGPPPWAPAHGYRAKHIYYYYPSTYVYFDIDRKVYFFMEGGIWKTSPVLPPVVIVDPDEHVVIELDTDKPYHHFKQHQKKYPPEKHKK
ncbi:MAG: hypothetical protein HXY47_06550 [Nitrospirae bacterium]|nr:hypothetical protein [Nitrospirota bacterium]